MEDPTTQGETTSKSVSEKSTSDTDHKKRDSSSTTSSKSSRSQDDSTTPTGKPPHRGQQPSAMPAMGPPPVPNFKATPTSAQSSQPMNQEEDQELPAASTEAAKTGGRQPAASSKHAGKDAMKATSRKRSHVEVEQQQTADDESASDEDYEPANPISAFDWMELESRYHQQMDQYGAQEQDLYRSFSELCGYFYVWAETGHGHEVERSFKRMKTQITLVQHNEEQLESRRQHYVKVVEAFKIVARMLNDGEKAALARPTPDDYANSVKTTLPHATIVDAYDWDDVHPSRCVIL